jgi:hypothetical protein
MYDSAGRTILPDWLQPVQKGRTRILQAFQPGGKAIFDNIANAMVDKAYLTTAVEPFNKLLDDRSTNDGRVPAARPDSVGHDTVGGYNADYDFRSRTARLRSRNGLLVFAIYFDAVR